MTLASTHSHYFELTARASHVAGAAHTNFPVLVTEQWLTAAQRTSLFGTARSDGADFRFASSSDGTTQYAFELIAYDNSLNQFIAWVLVPALSGVSDTHFYLFVADPDASLPAASAANGRASVWADYDAVYHGQSLTNAASATGVGDLTAVGSPQFNQSPITTGGRFQISAGNYYESVGYTPLLGPGDKTICAAIDLAASPPASAQGILNIGPNTTAGGRLTYFVQASTGYLALAVRSDTILSSSAVPAQVRTAFVYDGSESVNASLYTDGSVHTSDTLDDVDTLAGSEFRLGRQQSTLDFDGFLSEIWLRPSAVSGDWLATEHANQSNPGAFGFAGDMQST
ncbi:MAG: hypothetical protein AAF862_08225, partial [Pseudomonadota bacterium]